MPKHLATALVVSLSFLASCGQPSQRDPSETYGPNPKLDAAKQTAIPIMNPAKASSWPKGISPKAPAGFVVQRLAEDLDHPRWIYVLPNGDILVAEANRTGPHGKSIEDRVAKSMMAKAGAGVPSANRIRLIRDQNGDGVPELVSTFLTGLNAPFGMALVGEELFVANTDSVVKFPYQTGQTQITSAPIKIASLPTGTPNNHWTRNIIADPEGQRLYVTVGSNSNIGENGLESEVRRANVLSMKLDGSDEKVFASGLRNPNGLAWEPITGKLWTTVNERDMLGNDTPPDYFTSLQEGGFYGWPYSYQGRNVDPRVRPPRPDLVAKAIRPDYALGAHTASLGLAFYTASQFPVAYHGGAFIGQHGSWNRKPRSGYKVVFIPFKDGAPNGPPQSMLTGFITDKDEAMGRPVGVAIDQSGALLVADDVGNIIWRVAAQSPAP